MLFGEGDSSLLHEKLVGIENLGLEYLFSYPHDERNQPGLWVIIFVPQRVCFFLYSIKFPCSVLARF